MDYRVPKGSWNSDRLAWMCTCIVAKASCLIIQPFSGTGTATISDGELSLEAPADGSQVSAAAGNGLGGDALVAIEPLERGGAVLAELARAVEHDLAT